MSRRVDVIDAAEVVKAATQYRRFRREHRAIADAYERSCRGVMPVTGDSDLLTGDRVKDAMRVALARGREQGALMALDHTLDGGTAPEAD